jgi:hypothetical protein
MLNYLQEKFADALECFNKAIQMNARCPASVRVGASACAFHLKEYTTARRHAEKALQMDVCYRRMMFGA